MNEKTILASKSLTITSKLPNENILDKIITVGSDGDNTTKSYLYFDLSSINAAVKINEANIVLFKTDNFYNKKDIFLIYALTDYFSSFTTYNIHPTSNHVIKLSFLPFVKKVAVSINATRLVNKWIKIPFSNKGLLISGQKSVNSQCNFGSAINEDVSLIPVLRINYSEVSGIPSNITINSNTNEKLIKSGYLKVPLTLVSASYISQSIQGNLFAEGTFFITNNNLTDVTVSTQVSGDNIIWAEDDTSIIKPNETIGFVLKRYGNYYRVKSTLNLNISFTYQSYF